MKPRWANLPSTSFTERSRRRTLTPFFCFSISRQTVCSCSSITEPFQRNRELNRVIKLYSHTGRRVANGQWRGCRFWAPLIGWCFWLSGWESHFELNGQPEWCGIRTVAFFSKLLFVNCHLWTCAVECRSGGLAVVGATERGRRYCVRCYRIRCYGIGRYGIGLIAEASGRIWSPK